MDRVQIMVAALSADDEWCCTAGSDRVFDALVIVNMARQHKVRHASGVANRVFEDVSHLRTAAVKDVERENRMMQRQNESPVGGVSGKLVGDPLLVYRIDISALGNVGVHADERGKGRHQRPVRVGKVQADRKSTRLNSSHLVISYAVF